MLTLYCLTQTSFSTFILSPYWNNETDVSEKFASPDTLQIPQENPRDTNGGVLSGLVYSLSLFMNDDELITQSAKILWKCKIKTRKFKHHRKKQRLWQYLNSSKNMPKKDRVLLENELSEYHNYYKLYITCPAINWIHNFAEVYNITALASSSAFSLYVSHEG